MLDRLGKIRKAWRADYRYGTLAAAAASALINGAFTLFNGVLGIVYHSVWHGSVCVYYLLLAVIRAILVLSQRDPERSAARQSRLCLRTHLLLLLMNVALVVPLAVMVMGERSYSYGLIPAIAMAAYTTYRITAGVVHFRKSRKSDDSLVSELRLIGLTDALVALLTLQNTMILANGGMSREMQTLSAWTSAGIFAAIVLLTLRSFQKAWRARR